MDNELKIEYGDGVMYGGDPDKIDFGSISTATPKEVPMAPIDAIPPVKAPNTPPAIWNREKTEVAPGVVRRDIDYSSAYTLAPPNTGTGTSGNIKQASFETAGESYMTPEDREVAIKLGYKDSKVAFPGGKPYVQR